MKNFLILTVLAVVILNCNGLHFYIQEGREKCLMDDIPKGTHVIGYWDFMEPIPGVDMNDTQNGVTIRIQGPDGKDIKKFLTTYGQAKNHKGKFSLATQESGNYKFCMKTTTSHWVMENKKVKYGLRLVVGESEEVEDAAKDKDVSGLHQKIKDILRTSQEFSKFQEMQRVQEDQLSGENLKVNDRVVLATIIQTIVILCSVKC